MSKTVVSISTARNMKINVILLDYLKSISERLAVIEE